MKKTISLSILLIISCCLTRSSQASVIEPSPFPAVISSMPLRQFIKLNTRDLAVATGKKLSLKEQIAFTLLKPSMKKAVRMNPGITLGEYLAAKKKMKTWLKILLIVLGVIVIAFIIFAIAYGAGSE